MRIDHVGIGIVCGHVTLLILCQGIPFQKEGNCHFPPPDPVEEHQKGICQWKDGFVDDGVVVAMIEAQQNFLMLLLWISKVVGATTKQISWNVQHVVEATELLAALSLPAGHFGLDLLDEWLVQMVTCRQFTTKVSKQMQIGEKVEEELEHILFEWKALANEEF